MHKGLLRRIAVSVVILGVTFSFPFNGATAKGSLKHTPNAKIKRLSIFNPLIFVPNRGQTDSKIKYSAQLGKVAVLCTRKGLILRVGDETVTLEAKGNGAERIYGSVPLITKVNYFLGSDPSKWQRNLPTFGEVVFENIFDGIDMVVSGDEGKITTDFVVYPGAKASAIKMLVKGAKATVDEKGQLALNLKGQTITFTAPVSYQAVDGRIKEVKSSFWVTKTGSVYGFALGSYNEKLPVVIDPTVVWSTYLGNEMGHGVAVDRDGYIYVTGEGINAFVSKIDISGTILYTTYFGGSGGYNEGLSIRVDSQYVYIVGETSSNDLPNAINSFGGLHDAFVAKLDTSGNLIFTLYIGGSGLDVGQSISLDSNSNIYITGFTESTNMPMRRNDFTPPAEGCNSVVVTYDGQSHKCWDAFVTKIDSNGSIIFTTYVGGNKEDLGVGLEVDSYGYIYMLGQTNSLDLPNPKNTPPPYCEYKDFMAQINPMGNIGYTIYLKGTCLGGNGIQTMGGITIDSQNNVYVTSCGSICKLSTDGEISYCFDPPATYTRIRTDSDNHLYVSGISEREDIANAVNSYLGGTSDAFAGLINPYDGSLMSSIYLGGSGFDAGLDIAADQNGHVYLVGFTSSTDLEEPTNSYPGSGRIVAFIAKLEWENTSINSPPIIDSFETNPSSGNAPLNVNLTCSAHDPDNNIARYEITFGDGFEDSRSTSSSSVSFSHTYNSPGTYTATCKVIDEEGAYDSVTRVVQVTDEHSNNHPPVIDSFTVSPASGNAPLSVSFSCSAHDSDGEVVRYIIEPGDGSQTETTTTGSATHTYSSPGTYTATCVAVDDKGAESQSISVKIVVFSSSGGGGSPGGEPVPSSPVVKQVSPADSWVSFGKDAEDGKLTGSEKMSLAINSPQYQGKVDLYVAIAIPGVLLFVDSANQIVAYSGGPLPPFRTNVSESVNLVFFEDFPLYNPLMGGCLLPEGDYWVYTLVVPAGTNLDKMDWKNGAYELDFYKINVSCAQVPWGQ